MSDIDFLANQKPADDQEPKSQDDKAEPIIWSKPAEDKPLIKEVPFSWLAFLNKKTAAKKLAATPKPMVDKSKIIKSRREILELIKRSENSRPEEKNKSGQGFLAGLMERFKKQPSHKEVLIDYQQVFNQEKVKRSLSTRQAVSPATQAGFVADQLSAKKFDSSAGFAATEVKKELQPPLSQKPGLEGWLKRASRDWGRLIKQSSKRPVLDEKSAAAQPVRFIKNVPLAKIAAKTESARPIKAASDSFLSRFFKMIKDIIAALNRPKLKPAKTNLARIISSTKSELSKPPPSKPVPEARREIKTQPLEPKESAQIKEEPLEILETNLIKGEIITFFDWHNKIIILINAIFIPIVIMAVIYFGLMYYQKQNQARAKDQVKKLSQLTVEIKQEEIGLKEVTDFQSRLKLVSQIFAKHIYWTNLFKFLEENTMRDVYYTNFNGDTSGNYSLDAIASNFSNISEQVGILRNNEKVTDVRTVGGEAIANDATKKNGVKFNISFSILKSIFTE